MALAFLTGAVASGIAAAGLTTLLLWMATARTKALKARETSLKDIALRQPNWPEKATQIGNCFSNQFEIPVLFYILIALALPLHKTDLVIVLMSWVFGDALHPCRDFRDLERCPAARVGLVRRRPCAARDVDLLRAANAAADLEHDPEKWEPVFRRRSCSKNNALLEPKVLNDPRCPAVRSH